MLQDIVEIIFPLFAIIFESSKVTERLLRMGDGKK